MPAVAPLQGSDPSSTPMILKQFRSMLDDYPWGIGSGVTFLFGFDFGTVHSTSVVDVAQESKEPRMGNVGHARIHVGGRQQLPHRVPSKVAIRSLPAKEIGGPRRCGMLFGHSVDKALKDGSIIEENVVDLLKLIFFPAYADNGTGIVGRLMKQTRAKHNAFINKIQEKYHGTVLCKDSLSEMEWDSQEVRDMEDVVVAYLQFMWRNTLQEVAHAMGIVANDQDRTYKKLRQVFEKESHVVVSVPTVWPRTTQDRFLKLLGRAGFPSSTATVSEAISAAIGHFSTTPAVKGHKGKAVNMIVADIGGATLDVAGVSKYFRGESARFREVVPQIGSHNGSLTLNLLMEEHIRQVLGNDRLQSVLNHLGWTADKWSQRVMDGFELTKRLFNNDEIAYLIHLPDLPKGQDFEDAQKAALVSGFKLISTGLYVGKAQVRRVFDEWLKGLIEAIRQSLDHIRESDPRAPAPLLALCGWGSLPPYVLRKCEEEFPNNNVTRIEEQQIPLIAQGNFVMLVRADLFFDVPARESYGIRYDMHETDIEAAYQNELEDEMVEHGEYLCDRALWFVRKGEDLIHPKRKFFLERKTMVLAKDSRSTFPFIWKIQILATDDEVKGIDKYGAVSKGIDDGKIRVVGEEEIEIHYRDCKIKPETWPTKFGEPSYLEFNFRVRVDCSAICPEVVISLPKEKHFKIRLDDQWTETADDCHQIPIPLGLLHAHTALQGNREAKLDAVGVVDDDDDDEEE